MKMTKAELKYKQTEEKIKDTQLLIEDYFIKINPLTWTEKDLTGIFDDLLSSIPILELNQAIKELKAKNTEENKNYNHANLLEITTKYLQKKEIKKFIKTRFNKANDSEKEYIEDRIINEFAGCESANDLDGNFIRKLAGEEKSFKNEMLWHKIKKISRYAWTVLINLIQLAIILAVLDESKYSSNEILYPLLVIIYLSISGFFLRSTIISINLALYLDGRFKILRRLLKDNISKYEEEGMRVAKIKYENTMIKMYISSIFISIAYIVTIIQLFDSL